MLSKYPNIKPRTFDPDYINEVKIWYEKLMPRLDRFWYGNGGPIIMVQVQIFFQAVQIFRCLISILRVLILK